MREEQQRIHESVYQVYSTSSWSSEPRVDIFLTREYSHFRRISSFLIYIFQSVDILAFFFFYTHFPWFF